MCNPTETLGHNEFPFDGLLTPNLTDDMLIPGTPRNEAYTRWMEKLEGLEDELQAFVRNTDWMLEEFFQDVPSRKQ